MGQGKPRRRSRSQARHLVHQERIERAVQLRLKQRSYIQIGREMGVSRQLAHRLVHEAMLRRSASIDQKANILRALELERIDALWEIWWPRAVPETEGQLPSLDAAKFLLELQAARRRYVAGLDVTRDGKGMSVPELLQWVARMADAVKEFVKDEMVLAQIAERMRAIPLPNGATNPVDTLPLIAGSAEDAEVVEEDDGRDGTDDSAPVAPHGDGA